LLALLIYQPPLRTNFYSSANIINTNQIKPNDLNNYLYLTETNEAGFIVNNDKVSNSRIFKNKNKIEIANDKLINIVKWSFKKYPRRFLFENEKGGEVSEDTLRTYLRDITKIKNINFDLMRSIYVTEAYNTSAFSLCDRIELALKMRHSYEIASRAYFKIEATDQNKEEDTEILTALTIENNELKTKLDKLEPKEGDKLYNKRRSDILSRIKRGLTVKASTLEKYKIISEA